jgi:putative transposase
MPRPTRIDVPGLPQHLYARGNNRSPFFFTDLDRRVFLRYLKEAARDNGCDVHAFVLMTNHFHLLATGNARGALSRMMQAVGRRYVAYVNRAYGRTGTLFEGRFKASVVETERYFLTCMRYIELNPVRAHMAANPRDYPWSSFRKNASGAPSGWLVPHCAYLALGDCPSERGRVYRSLFEAPVPDHALAEIREHVGRNCALGSEAFQQALEVTLGRRVRIARVRKPHSMA